MPATKQVKFFCGLASNYAGLQSKDPNAVYFITDEPYIYFNNVKYGATAKDIKAISSITLSGDNKTLTIKYTDGTSDDTIVLQEATTTVAGLMSAADKIKLDGLEDSLQSASTYQSSLDEGLATLTDHGGIKAGTTVEQLNGMTYTEMFDEILFPTVYPTYKAPSASLSLKSTSTTPTIQEIGTTGASVPADASAFNTGYNPGAININGVKKQDRGGALKPGESFIYINNTPSNTTFPTEIPNGTITYKYRAAYEAGPQPVDSKGNNYETPLAAGTVDSGAVTITGVYPYFTNAATVNGDNTFNKLALTTSSSLNGIAFNSEGPNKHAFKLPAAYTLTKVDMLNTLSGKYEDFGVSRWTTSSESIQVQGKPVEYTIYTRNDSGFSGEATFNITFSK